MPSYFLTVCFPLGILWKEDWFSDTVSLDDYPPGTYEKEPHVFYETDSESVAGELVKLFRHAEPPSRPGLEPLAKSPPVFEAASADGMDIAQRVVYRQNIKFLERMALCDGDPGIREDAGLPNDRRTVLLWEYYERAREWEPDVRGELGVDKSDRDAETATGGKPGDEAVAVCPGKLVASQVMPETEYFLRLTIGYPLEEICFYSLRDSKETQIVSRLCNLFTMKYSNDDPNTPEYEQPQFDYLVAADLDPDSVLLIREEIEIFREPNVWDPKSAQNYFRNLINFRQDREHFGSFCFQQAAVWEERLRTSSGKPSQAEAGKTTPETYYVKYCLYKEDREGTNLNLQSFDGVEEDVTYFYRLQDGQLAERIARLFNKRFEDRNEGIRDAYCILHTFSCQVASEINEDERFFIDEEIDKLSDEVERYHFQCQVDWHETDEFGLPMPELPIFDSEKPLSPVSLYDQARRWEERLRPKKELPDGETLASLLATLGAHDSKPPATGAGGTAQPPPRKAAGGDLGDALLENAKALSAAETHSKSPQPPSGENKVDIEFLRAIPDEVHTLLGPSAPSANSARLRTQIVAAIEYHDRYGEAVRKWQKQWDEYCRQFINNRNQLSQHAEHPPREGWQWVEDLPAMMCDPHLAGAPQGVGRGLRETKGGGGGWVPADLSKPPCFPPNPMPGGDSSEDTDEITLMRRYVALAAVHDRLDAYEGRTRARLLAGFELPPQNVRTVAFESDRPYLMWGKGFERTSIEQALEAVKADIAALTKGGGTGSKTSQARSDEKPPTRPGEPGQTKRQPWSKDAPEYLPLTEAVKLTDGYLKVQTLSKKMKPAGEMRYMQKGQRCKVHIADFLRYIKSQVRDPEYHKLLVAFMACEGKGDLRFAWKCSNCSAVVSKTDDRCPKRDCPGHEPSSFAFKIERVPPPKPLR